MSTPSKKFRARSFSVLSWALLLSFCSAGTLSAQVNSWLKPTSGNWEENQWSLGTLPGAGQSVLITNAGWKAVAIGPGTLSYPGSLTVYSITLASPADSHNVLLFNYPGQAVPLTTRFFTVASNAAITLHDGALNLNGGGGEGMSVGGEVDQEDSSTVLGSQMDIGYIGPGVYSLRSGTVWLQHVWVGGAYNGQMLQTGGTNAADIVHLEDGGRYELVDGDFNARDVYFERGAVLRQTGGRINGGLAVYNGTYQLDGGVIYGGVTLPASDGYSSSGGNGGMLQTGGTNLGRVNVGYLGGYGSYVLSNGVSFGRSLTVGARGAAQQWNGSQTVTGMLSTVTDWIGRMVLGSGSYTLNSGILSAGSMNIGGYYAQTGGTNVVTGDISINGAHADFRISGGELRNVNMALIGSWNGGYTLAGGRHVVSGIFSIGLDSSLGFKGWHMTGGELVVSTISLLSGAKFTKTGGTVTQSGRFTLRAANVTLGAGTHRFGAMELRADASGNTNSTIHLPMGASCVLAFGESRLITWSNSARLLVMNWSGTWTGGGDHQLYFGASAAGLTPAQAGQITFQDPAGFAPGFYGPAAALRS